MAFVLFERALDGNTMIAILIVAILEYLLGQMRSSLAQANLPKTSYIEEMFLC